MSDKLRVFVYAVLIDVLVIGLVVLIQTRTKAGLDVLSRRLRGDSDAAFPHPRFLGNGNVEDFERFAAELEQQRRTAATDPVTGLRNRATLQTDLLLHAEVAARGSEWLSSCVADLDHFKSINDRHGHTAGDMVLRQLGDRLQRSVGAAGLVGRWGGDEFVMILPRLDLASSRELADRARRDVAESPFVLGDGTRLPLTMTVGVASGQGDRLDAHALFEAADADLLETKAGGRNRVGMGRRLS